MPFYSKIRLFSLICFTLYFSSQVKAVSPGAEEVLISRPLAKSPSKDGTVEILFEGKDLRLETALFGSKNLWITFTYMYTTASHSCWCDLYEVGMFPKIVELVDQNYILDIKEILKRKGKIWKAIEQIV